MSGCPLCNGSQQTQPAQTQQGREVRLKQFDVVEYDGKGNREYLVKVVLLGDSAVGKTSIMRRFVDNSYNDDFKPTIGVDFATKQIEVDDAKVKLQIWDTAGQERYRSIAGTYYRGAAAALIIFDSTNKHSFESITRWVTEIQNASTDGREVILYIVANKTDLSDIRQVSRDDVRQFISSNNVRAEEAEVSAKENRGIAEVFEAIARKIAERGRQPAQR
eukprot:TRINITY_DN5120_c0_g2_i1.p2 TRINITY_DN5120_c0_g2~~TRINITY_DN5120_c0_g2_i1.p2  ORF type:complete len:219 (-),score=45.86 TRINITY_DN5120_c0_g2_i1:1411-2067(-)